MTQTGDVHVDEAHVDEVHIGEVHIDEVHIDEVRIDEMAKHVADNEGLENAWAPLLQEDIAAIFRASL